MPHVEKAFMNLSAKHDLILVEGAGSPAEINLRDGDIANMGFATKLSIPTIIIGDIDRGGVIASLVGTKAVLDSEDNKSLIGFIINRFRGDPKLFKNSLVLTICEPTVSYGIINSFIFFFFIQSINP